MTIGMSLAEMLFFVVGLSAIGVVALAIAAIIRKTLHRETEEIRRTGSAHDDALDLLVMGVRLRTLYAHACAKNHGHSGLSPELTDFLETVSSKLSTWMEETDLAEPSILWGEIRSAILTPAEDPDELTELLDAYSAQTANLDKKLAAELVTDCLAIASVHGKTARCLRTLRQISKALGLKIRKKRKARQRTETEDPPGIADACGYYALLGVDTDADLATIKSAYRRLAFEKHPDLSKTKRATQDFQQLNEAYQVLSDPLKRAEYDQL